MNMLKKVTLAAALAAGLLASGASSAGQICAGCQYRFNGDTGIGPGAPILGGPGAFMAAGVQASYLGLYNPSSGLPASNNGDRGSFTHGGLGTGSFTDYWIFQVNPSGSGEWDATFNPGVGVSSFSAKVFATSTFGLVGAAGPLTAATQCTDISNPGGGALGTNAGYCNSFGVLGSLKGSNGGPGANQLRISNLLLPAGWYAVEVKGTVVAGQSGDFYSGNISTSVPEPGSLALAALALLAAGAVLRRRA